MKQIILLLLAIQIELERRKNDRVAMVAYEHCHEVLSETP